MNLYTNWQMLQSSIQIRNISLIFHGQIFHTLKLSPQHFLSGGGEFPRETACTIKKLEHYGENVCCPNQLIDVDTELNKCL